ncbi:hypothetical protein ACJJTC_013352 [Scirpophaga incertulas]
MERRVARQHALQRRVARQHALQVPLLPHRHTVVWWCGGVVVWRCVTGTSAAARAAARAGARAAPPPAPRSPPARAAGTASATPAPGAACVCPVVWWCGGVVVWWCGGALPEPPQRRGRRRGRARGQRRLQRRVARQHALQVPLLPHQRLAPALQPHAAPVQVPHLCTPLNCDAFLA